MRLLLDTHAFIWWMRDRPQLHREARDAIAEGRSQVAVSAAVVWEIAIKRALGKLRVPLDLEEQIELQEFTPLPITITHAVRAGALPPHHDDPFDRMLVAQAQLEQLTIVTRDPRIAHYDVQILAA